MPHVGVRLVINPTASDLESQNDGGFPQWKISFGDVDVRPAHPANHHLHPDFVIPGHGTPSADVSEAVAATRDYIVYVRDTMRQAVADFMPFDQAYEAADWSVYATMPAFDASNRGNAYRIYLDLEAKSFE